MKCPMCNGSLKNGKVREEYLGHFLGEFDGRICTKCGETILGAESVRKAQEKAKELGIFGLSERTSIAKSGNSLVVRIKKTLANYLKLTEGKQVFIRPEGKDKLVIELA